jgi:hypothetical protein
MRGVTRIKEKKGGLRAGTHAATPLLLAAAAVPLTPFCDLRPAWRRNAAANIPGGRSRGCLKVRLEGNPNAEEASPPIADPR